MIAKQNRFHGRNSLNTVYRKGKAVRGEYASLRYASSRRKDYRLAVVVSRKVSKSAVVRNRIRRRIYEIVRLHVKDLAEPLPRDMVLSIFEERAAMATDLDKTILVLLQKIER